MEIKKEYKQYMKDIVRALPATLFFKDTEGRYVYATEICDLLNAGPEATIIGKRDYEIQRDKELGYRYYEEDMHILQTGESTHTVDVINPGDEDTVYMEIFKEAIRNDNGEIIGICGICNDVTELEKLRLQYEQLSLHDPVTGAYNRNYTIRYDFNNEESLPCSYIFCDCNHLKKINDCYGHNLGDRYIRKAFQILREAAEKDSVIVRWGGDEFLMITPRCNKTVHEKMIEKIKIFQTKLAVIKPEMGLAVGGKIRETLAVPESEVSRQADYNMYKDKELMHAVNAQIKDCMDNRSGGLRQYG